MNFKPIPLQYALEHLELAPELPSGLRWVKAPSPYLKRLVGHQAGRSNGRAYWRITLQGQDYLCHRVVWALKNQIDPNLTIDHINRNTNDNNCNNLRLADLALQSENRRFRNKSSQYHGVVLTPSGRWRARCHAPGSGRGSRKVSLGTFETEQAAWQAVQDYRNNS